ncbi:zinc-binding alcohol dehydrogenase family protein [Microlunatus elymi]|uniref:Zinc-binding alcohol dehydrogenase family protein n=1 Tax=Microlunatus elymi TaxID=2596828 RepID=A0A516Q483_9ACTN|nr:zinc-binding alcohol dehydrogenase family protein [Microlunatus elymi]QDP98021.1 zinc-binding alcohol dehydrogenase family protein [Microlunatus elymi]
MKAAVIDNFDQPPAYRDFADPVPNGPEELVEVVAAGVHQIVRGQASGRHYSSHRQLPMIPGVDGVCRRSDGSLAYFGGLRAPYGTFAERAAAPMLMPLPDGLDPAVVAASMNPGMSGWNALAVRAALQPGQSVVVLGATGASGQTAIQAAKLLGASEVIAVGRSAAGLRAVSEHADHTVRIDSGTDWPAQVAALADHVDVVVDYLWGEPAAGLLGALVAGRADSTRQLTWAQVGSMAGSPLALDSELLRSSNLHLIGSGLGSVPMEQIGTQLPAFLGHLAAGHLHVTPVRRRLADVTEAWSEPIPPGQRLVIVP